MKLSCDYRSKCITDDKGEAGGRGGWNTLPQFAFSFPNGIFGDDKYMTFKYLQAAFPSKFTECFQ